MSKKWIITMLAGVGVFVGARLLTFEILVANAQQVSLAPFTVVQDNYSYSGQGAIRLVSRETYARRSDGAASRVEEFPTNPMAIPSRSLEFPDGRKMGMLDGTLVRFVPASRLRAAQAGLQRAVSPPANCMDEPGLPVLSRSRAWDLDVVTLEYGGAQSRSKVTYAPQLGCFPLFIENQELKNGAWVATGGKVTVSLSRGEPSAKVFDSPTNTQAVSLTDGVMAAIKRRNPQVSDAELEAELNKVCSSCNGKTVRQILAEAESRRAE